MPEGRCFVVVPYLHSWQEKSTCARIAKRVKGVKGLRNNLDIRSANSRSDVVEAEIRHLLQWDAGVDESDIQVKVAGGRVTLSGHVASIGEKARQIKIRGSRIIIGLNDQSEKKLGGRF